MIQRYLNDDRTLERVVAAILEFRQQQTGDLMFTGKSAEEAVFILNSLLDELQEEPPDE